MSEITWLRYVRHADVPAYEALGWQIVPTSTVAHHDAYSRLMDWPGPGAPVEPKTEARP